MITLETKIGRRRNTELIQEHQSISFQEILYFYHYAILYSGAAHINKCFFCGHWPTFFRNYQNLAVEMSGNKCF